MKSYRGVAAQSCLFLTSAVVGLAQKINMQIQVQQGMF